MPDRQLYEVEAARVRRGGRKAVRVPTFWVWCEAVEEAKRQARAVLGSHPDYQLILHIREA